MAHRGAWIPGPAMQEARHWHAVAAVPANGRIYALGGWALEDTKVWGLAAPLPLFFLAPLCFFSCPYAGFRCCMSRCRLPFTLGTSLYIFFILKIKHENVMRRSGMGGEGGTTRCGAKTRVCSRTSSRLTPGDPPGSFHCVCFR